MFRNLSKVVLMSMLIVVVASSMSYATTARVRSLANTGDYMSDDSNVHRWLSTLPSYANQVNAEVGTFSGFGSLMDTRGLSWTFGTEEYGTYRVTINENAIDDAGFWMINPFYANFTPGMLANNLGGVGNSLDTPINRFDLGMGWEFGENHAVGVNVTRSSWSSTTSDTTSGSLSFTTIGAGYSWSNNEDLVADFVFNYAMGGGEFVDDSPANNTTDMAEYDSKGGINIAGRALWDWKDDITVPVNAEFVSVDYSFKESSTPTATPAVIPSGDKITGFRAGAGVNIDVNTDNMFIFAVEYANLKWEFSNPDTIPSVAGREVTATVLPTIRMALESQINSWLTTRIGAARHQYKIKVKQGTQNDTDYNDGTPFSERPGTPVGPPSINNWQAFEWFLGAGFNVAEWTIDLELADETPFSLGYWITGYSAFPSVGPGPVTRISAIYNY